MASKKYDLLIIGAGICGLMAASALRDQGLTVGVVDKGRSVGGRLATRRIGGGRADHGAQFFTVRDETFQRHVDRWIATGLVYEWSRGWSSGSSASGAPDGYPRYAVRDGMNMLAKRVAAELSGDHNIELLLSVQISALSQHGGDWLARDSQGESYQATTLIVTSPVPQSLAMLEAGGVQLSPDDQHDLEQVHYAPCLCGLFHINGEVKLPDPGAVQRPKEAITWIADNQAKGISPLATLLTVHAGSVFSLNNYDADASEVLPYLRAEIEPFLGANARIQEEQLKRWRYALPLVLHPAPFLRAAGLPPLYFGGDAFGGPRIEGAALSALAMANEIGNI